MRITLLTISVIISFAMSFKAEQFSRVRAQFTIKEKKIDGTSAMQIGTAYYDINVQKLIYDITFPQKELLVTTDSCTYRMLGDSVAAKSQVPGFIQQSIFHLVLSGNLKTFGLSKSPLKIEKVENDKGMVITTWVPEENNKLFSGKILVSTKDRKLFGVIYLNEKDEVLSKQFYENYQTVSGLAFPRKVIYILYQDGKEYYKSLEFRNIVLNEQGNNDYYDHSTGK